jgi:hypothetical protein
MTACAIRYRLDGPGPAAFLVDCNGHLRVYARGVLGGVMPTSRLMALLAERGCRWVPDSGRVVLDESLPESFADDASDRERAAYAPIGGLAGDNADLTETSGGF